MKFTAYRGSSGGSLWGMQPYKVSSRGTFGDNAIYFALDRETASQYSRSAGWFWTIVNYEVEVNNPLIVSEDNFSNLKSYGYGDPILVHGEQYKEVFPSSITRNELLDLAIAKGYDSVYLKGSIENGEELVLREGLIKPKFIEAYTNLAYHNFEKKNEQGIITYWEAEDFKSYIQELMEEGLSLGIEVQADPDNEKSIFVRGAFEEVISLGKKHWI